ncbi:MAG: 4-(cytidine 5'-diphospho)-2-C-methyl-D-erythritol kinase [Planctomycetes bacterium]|nr:4-(cytidine 5'-diphospho)-2-C-methyl-D-erythritol kinase [Planctomycetota bacterium]
MDSVHACAPCKVNPYLEVVRRRADGYHELETTLLALDLEDRLHVRATRSGRTTLRVFGEFAAPDIPSDERNLALAAADFARRFALDCGAASGALGLELELEKRIPSQAGLGGGSSDAAAALLAVEHLLGIDCGAEGERALARLGSDCVFFHRARSTGYARCTGRGEIVEPWPAVPEGLSALLVTPECGASTAAVYAALSARLRGAETPATLTHDFRRPDAPLVGAPLFNRLEEAALAAIPSLRPWRRLLDMAAPSTFRLAGSGASFFALVASLSEAQALRSLVESELRRAGLTPRGLWAVRAAGHGARVDL